MAQGDLRGQAPREHRLAVSAVALVLGVPQLGHQLPGPGRHGSSSEHEGSPQGPQLDTPPLPPGDGDRAAQVDRSVVPEAPLVEGACDAYTCFITNQPLTLKDQGIDYVAVPYSDLNFPDYADALFAKRSVIQSNRDAMVAFPQYISGTGRFDTELMLAASGRLACKSGAEGVAGTAALHDGVGFVVKVVDGSARARAPAVCAILAELGILRESEIETLQAFARPPVYNRAGRVVGEIRPAHPLAVSKARV